MAQKQFGKVIDIFITHTPGDLCLRHISIGQQPFRFRHTPLNHVVNGRNSILFSKFMTNITDAGTKFFSITVLK